MNALLKRCRHVQVNWLDTHSCHCLDCGKTGHWFELERLVMWTRGQKLTKHKSIIPTSAPLPNHLDSHAPVASRAG